MASSPLRFLIQLERLDAGRLSMAEVRSLLEKFDVQIDEDYGPICVARNPNRWVVRGEATEEARKSAEREGGVAFFPDASVRAVKR